MGQIFEQLNLDAAAPLNPKTVTDDRTSILPNRVYNGLVLYDTNAPAGVFVYTGTSGTNEPTNWEAIGSGNLRVESGGNPRGNVDVETIDLVGPNTQVTQSGNTEEATFTVETAELITQAAFDTLIAGNQLVSGRYYEIDDVAADTDSIPADALPVIEIDKGGTGATTLEAAQTALVIPVFITETSTLTVVGDYTTSQAMAGGPAANFFFVTDHAGLLVGDTFVFGGFTYTVAGFANSDVIQITTALPPPGIDAGVTLTFNRGEELVSIDAPLDGIVLASGTGVTFDDGTIQTTAATSGGSTSIASQPETGEADITVANGEFVIGTIAGRNLGNIYENISGTTTTVTSTSGLQGANYMIRNIESPLIIDLLETELGTTTTVGTTASGATTVELASVSAITALNQIIYIGTTFNIIHVVDALNGNTVTFNPPLPAGVAAGSTVTIINPGRIRYNGNVVPYLSDDEPGIIGALWKDGPFVKVAGQPGGLTTESVAITDGTDTLNITPTTQLGGDTFPSTLVFLDDAANQFTVGQKNRIRTNTNTGNFTIGVADSVGDGADVSGETGTEGQVTVIQNQSGESKTLIYKTGTGQPQLLPLLDDSFTQFKSNGTGWVIISRSVRQGGNVILDTGSSVTFGDGTTQSTAGSAITLNEDPNTISDGTTTLRALPDAIVEEAVALTVGTPTVISGETVGSDFLSLSLAQGLLIGDTFDHLGTTYTLTLVVSNFVQISPVLVDAILINTVLTIGRGALSFYIRDRDISIVNTDNAGITIEPTDIVQSLVGTAVVARIGFEDPVTNGATTLIARALGLTAVGDTFMLNNVDVNTVTVIDTATNTITFTPAYTGGTITFGTRQVTRESNVITFINGTDIELTNGSTALYLNSQTRIPLADGHGPIAAINGGAYDAATDTLEILGERSGTWTPSYSLGTAVTVGTWTRFGSSVIAHAQSVISGVSGTDVFTLAESSLPFAPDNSDAAANRVGLGTYFTAANSNPVNATHAGVVANGGVVIAFLSGDGGELTGSTINTHLGYTIFYETQAA